MLQVNQQQPWRVEVRVKSKKFYLSLKASKITPFSKIFRFSIRFKLHPLVFKIKSKPHSSFSWKPKSLKHKLFQLFRPKRTKKDGIVGKWCARKCSVCASLALVGTVVPRLCTLLWDNNGFAFLNSISWLCFLGLGLKNRWFGGRRGYSFWVMVTVSAMGVWQYGSRAIALFGTILADAGYFGSVAAASVLAPFLPRSRIGLNILFITVWKPDARLWRPLFTGANWQLTGIDPDRLLPSMAWLRCSSKDSLSYWSSNVLCSSPKLLEMAAISSSVSNWESKLLKITTRMIDVNLNARKGVVCARFMSNGQSRKLSLDLLAN